MPWHDSLSQSEIQEMIDDACSAYHQGMIEDSELRQQLSRLGLNATDISDLEKQHRPPPPEEDLEL